MRFPFLLYIFSNILMPMRKNSHCNENNSSKVYIAVRLNSTTIKIVCSTADFPRSSIFFSFPSPPNQKVMDLEVTPRRISTPFPSPFQDY